MLVLPRSCNYAKLDEKKYDMKSNTGKKITYQIRQLSSFLFFVSASDAGHELHKTFGIIISRKVSWQTKHARENSLARHCLFGE